jgi:hypothetical protein
MENIAAMMVAAATPSSTPMTGGDAKNRAVRQRRAARKASQDIDRHGENAVDQHFGCEAHFVFRKHNRHGRQHGHGER